MLSFVLVVTYQASILLFKSFEKVIRIQK